MIQHFLVSVDVGPGHLSQQDVAEVVDIGLEELRSMLLSGVVEVDAHTAYQVRENMDQRWR